jgi:hypothetical protein
MHMNDKPVKSPSADSKKAERDTGRATDADLTKNAPRPVREGPENLDQRAEWFRRRTGEK